MSWFSRKPTQQEYINAAVKVASNLYFHTIPGADDAPAPLQFSLPDSRYRYMMFCLSAVVMAALVYDEKKEVQPDVLINGCLHFATWSGTEMSEQYFDKSVSSQDYLSDASVHLEEFLKCWSVWPELEKEDRHDEILDLICSMIHTTESNLPAENSDMERLRELALWIDCRLPTMQGAFLELAIKRSI